MVSQFIIRRYIKCANTHQAKRKSASTIIDFRPNSYNYYVINKVITSSPNDFETALLPIFNFFKKVLSSSIFPNWYGACL